MIKKKETKVEMRELVDLLKKWNYEYYVLDSPSVSDSVYDFNYKKLEKIEKETNFFFIDSPTKNIGSEIEESFNDNALNKTLKLVRRKKPMLSIDNVNNYENLHRFDRRIKKETGKDQIEYICELKIDGISVSAIYKNGKIDNLTTRGDGFVGEDVTENKNLILNMPQAICENNCEVRGEIYMDLEEFNLINKNLTEKGFKALSNPRNAAAGSLRTILLKSSELKKRQLKFFSYQFLPNERFETQKECLDFLENNGFQVPENELCSNINLVENFIEKIERKRKNLDFLIDGVVIKVNNYKDCFKLGETNKFPRWSLAYKFVSSEVLSTIKDILVEVGKNGRLSYVALIEPVNLEGSLIKRVTLHNYAFIKNNLININDEVLIKKSGDVIPQISKITKKSESYEWKPNEHCPSCSSKLFWSKNNLYQICGNELCHDKIINYLLFCSSKSALNIKGVSKSTIEKIHNLGILEEPSDFYDLSKKEEILNKVFKEKTLKNIISSIEKSKSQYFYKLISSLSIPLLSIHKSKILSSFFSNDMSLLIAFFKDRNDNSFLELRKILGEKTLESFDNFFSNDKNLLQLEKLSQRVEIIK